MKYVSICVLLLGFQLPASAQDFKKTSLPDEPPLATISRVADKIVHSVDFNFQLSLRPPQQRFDFIESIDFARTCQSGKPGVAYAFTTLESDSDRQMVIDISYSDEIMIWLNNSLVFSSLGPHQALVISEERGLRLMEHFQVYLKKGCNELLIKSATSGKEWKVFIQPGGALIEAISSTNPLIRLKGLPYVSEHIARLTNWLIAGPFPNPLTEEGYSGIKTVYPPENGFKTGELYQGTDGPVTWTIPKVEVFGNLIGAHPLWGSYYNYNYHTAGVAWAMMHLSKYTGDSIYDRYAKNYTDFHLRTKPFVEYQVKKLHGFNSVNHFLIETPLLDFTLAPSLPYVERLLGNNDFKNRKEYENWVNNMIDYALNNQSRDQDGHFNRLTPVKYTTWTDDMFMGLPFLVLASRITKDRNLKQQLLEDAVNQIFAFNNHVWDSDVSLYRHAQYSEYTVKMPHWSRANGWAIWAISEVLKALPENYPAYKKLLAHFKQHVRGLTAVQDTSGFWFNVLDEPLSNPETSGTAIFTMAIARGINQGWLSRQKYEQYAMKGWKALQSVIESDGTVHGICMGTMCSEDLQYYLDRPILDDDSHGILGLFFAAIEMQKLIYPVKQ